MKSFLQRIPLFLLCSTIVSAEPLGIDQSLEFVVPPTGANFIRWHGKPGRTYFIQVSDPSDHLNTWKFEPIIETGNDEPISHQVLGTAEKGFFRLKFSDQPTTDPDGDDFDYDCLSNWDEVSEHGTDPMEWDTDGDGLSDPWEIAHNLDPNDNGSIDPDNGANGDPDGDLVDNLTEYWYNGNPRLEDTDGDGLTDGDELYVYFTILSFADWDGDNLNDYAEVITHGSDPYDRDSDKDTLDDGDEVLIHLSNPLKMDTDGDWMWDDWELDNNLDPTNAADGLLDADNDTLLNQLEFVFLDNGYDPFVANNAAVFPWTGDPDLDELNTQAEFTVHLTNPRQHDSDGDCLSDGWEIAHSFNARLNNRNDGPANHHPDADPDYDDLTNAEEDRHRTNPHATDSDGDGVSDGDEINQGSNPNDPNDSQPPPNGTVPVNVTFGDPSDSHSEKYQVLLTPLEGDTTGHTTRYRTNRDYGVPQTDTFHLPKGAKYKVELLYAGTSPTYRDDPRPDYDYVLQIDTSANGLVVDDPQGIMGNHNEGDPFFASGKNATLHVPLFEWVIPKGSPVTEPSNSNQFVYGQAAIGVLDISLEIEVFPSGTATLLANRCKFMLPEINGSVLDWVDGANPDGVPTASGNFLRAAATYTNLPEFNSSFGLKQAEFECDSVPNIIPKADFEVFFMKNATNHAGGQAGTPNWFHYWKQFVIQGRIGTLIYDNNIGWYGSTDGQARQTKVSSQASETNEETMNEGLHAFYETLVHESYHISLWEGWWGVGGERNNEDDTDFDEYPNNFEIGAEGIEYGFDPNDFGDAFDRDTNSAGTRYEEDKCTEQEHLIQNISIYDYLDWSYSTIIKGKNQ